MSSSSFSRSTHQVNDIGKKIRKSILYSTLFYGLFCIESTLKFARHLTLLHEISVKENRNFFVLSLSTRVDFNKKFFLCRTGWNESANIFVWIKKHYVWKTCRPKFCITLSSASISCSAHSVCVHKKKSKISFSICFLSAIYPNSNEYSFRAVFLSCGDDTTIKETLKIFLFIFFYSFRFIRRTGWFKGTDIFVWTKKWDIWKARRSKFCTFMSSASISCAINKVCLKLIRKASRLRIPSQSGKYDI